MSMHRGFCRCGGVSIEAHGRPHFAGYCHCDDCRRSNGAPVACFAGFQDRNFEWTGKDTLAEWRNGAYRRLFCESCGAPVAYADDNVPDVVFFYSGFMENAESFPPEHHSYYQYKISWLDLADDLPKHEHTSYPRPQ